MEGEGNHFFLVVFHFILFPLSLVKCFQKDFLTVIINLANLDNAVVWIHSFLQPYVPIPKRLNKMKLMPKISRNLILVFLHDPPKVTTEKIPSDMEVAPRYTRVDWIPLRLFWLLKHLQCIFMFHTSRLNTNMRYQ